MRTNPVVAWVVAVTMAASTAMGQATTRPDTATTTPPPAAKKDSSTGLPISPLFTKGDLWTAAGFTAATIAMFPLDKYFARELQRPSPQASHFFRYSSKAVTFLGSPGSLIIGTSLWGVGRLAHNGKMADLGLHGVEAILVGGAITDVTKMLAGRRRPFAAGVDHPDDFGLGAGFQGASHQSFPSGHTTAAFAAASAVTAETHGWWPHSTWYVAPIMFGGATMVGLARMYNNKHWASDVVLGAAIGTFSGFKVVHWNHAHPKNTLNHWFLRTTVAPLPNGGGVVAFSMPWEP